MNTSIKNLLLLYILILSGCAHQPIAPPVNYLPTEDAWTVHQLQLERLENWKIRGKFSIKQDDKATTANLTWVQSTPDHYEIALSGPLGQGTVQLSGRPNQVIFKDARGNIDRARDAQTLLYQHTGWSLPIASLYYWTRGLPDPNYPSQYVLSDQGRVLQLKQHDWQLAYEEYQQYDDDDEDDYVVPRKIILWHDDTRITLLLNTWQINTDN